MTTAVGGAVVERLLGKEFTGVLGSDFYAAYNVYLGRHQRCWVHLLRHLHELREAHADEDEVLRWVQGVRAVYDDAQAWLVATAVWLQANARPSQAARETQYLALLARLQPLGLAYAQNKGHACQALAKRLLRHQDELFQFLLIEGLSTTTSFDAQVGQDLRSDGRFGRCNGDSRPENPGLVGHQDAPVNYLRL